MVQDYQGLMVQVHIHKSRLKCLKTRVDTEKIGFYVYFQSDFPVMTAIIPESQLVK